MNAMNTVAKTFACGLGAIVISTIMSYSVVTSTSAVPFATATSGAPVQVARSEGRSHHLAMAKSGPAVLVD